MGPFRIGHMIEGGITLYVGEAPTVYDARPVNYLKGVLYSMHYNHCTTQALITICIVVLLVKQVLSSVFSLLMYCNDLMAMCHISQCRRSKSMM